MKHMAAWKTGTIVRGRIHTGRKKNMASGHTVFEIGVRSPCPWHDGLCAYTGKETDRCPGCHSLWDNITSCRCCRCGSHQKHREVHVRDWGRREKKRLRAGLWRSDSSEKGSLGQCH